MSESTLRRKLDNAGYRLTKSRLKIGCNNYGGYMIINNYYNCVVAGSCFSLSLDDVREFVSMYC